MLYNLLERARNELADSSIESIAIEFESVMSEFLALSEAQRNLNIDYDDSLNQMIDVICENYNLRRQFMHIKASNYTTDLWGNVYWRFLHLGSILITDLLWNRKIENTLDLPLIVYNIDYVLPCPMCSAHYATIKPTNAVKAAVKEIAFGNLMSGVQAFHNLVTENVDKTLEYANRPKRPPFTIVDFARVYKCIELPPKDTLKSVTYIRNRVDWQPDTHRILTTFYALASRSSYLSSSEFLKHEVYPAISNESSSVVNRALELIENGILMNIDADLLSVEANKQIYNRVLQEMYTLYPECVQQLIDNMPDIDTATTTTTKIKYNKNGGRDDDNNNDNGGEANRKEQLQQLLNALRK